ncbi:MAG: hypothetical protein U0797_07805 [Gemmataceae bacterium]
MKPDLVMALALLLAGCTAPTIDVSVPSDHPASPSAAEAPVPEAFAVLDPASAPGGADDEDAASPHAAGGSHQHHGHQHHKMGGAS